ncbi:6692_t:CDS:2 [Scutellospora calospora]|uniref:6692_t:CDS:1 n=1 Tax=Scutellospora calospora TaxID=85575 RepID=A0ACA9LFF9_9GLOM|nr:6692_t:CDS:2 [Scutellospora calospora]
MPDYNIQTFHLTSFTEILTRSDDDPTISLTDNIFRLYTLRNEINQNLSNAFTNFNFLELSLPSYEISNFSYQHLTLALCRLIHQFQTKILSDYPNIPCAYCSILISNSSVFSLPVHNKINNRNVIRVAVCNGCKNEKTCCYPPVLAHVPPQINNVPMMYRKYLSPVFMNCLLGRTAGANPYTNYRHLEGTINLSHNYRTFELYSRLIGCYLNINEPPNWFHHSLIPAFE